jgi:hypothetical protein
MINYLLLHLDTHYVKEQLVVKRIWCKWTCETNQHYTKTQIKVNEQLVVRKDIDVNEHDRLYNITYRLKLRFILDNVPVVISRI